MGSQAPQLDILEIGELSEERFRGIFKLCYNGDARVVLQTKVQANPLTGGGCPDIDKIMRPIIVGADAPLIVPLELQISQFKLRGIFVLIVSLMRGVTVSFKNDPLESVQVNSTFDNSSAIRRHLQREIEQRLRDLIKDQIPLLVHNLSMEPIRQIAESIPPPFKVSSPPPGYFRHRRSQSMGLPDASSPCSGSPSSFPPSRTSSPINSSSLGSSSSSPVYDEIYYFRRRSMIHRTVSRISSCDPLAGPNIPDLRRRDSSLLEDVVELVEKIPWVGEDVRDYIESRIDSLRCKDSYKSFGLKDSVLFQADHITPPRMRSGSQIIFINSGSHQLQLRPETVAKLSQDETIRRPSIFKAPRVITEGNILSDTNEILSIHDPEEFRSVDSVPLRSPSPFEAPLRNNATLGPASLQRSVQRGPLSGKLAILRALHCNPSPFVQISRTNVIHRSSPK